MKDKFIVWFYYCFYKLYCTWTEYWNLVIHVYMYILNCISLLHILFTSCLMLSCCHDIDCHGRNHYYIFLHLLGSIIICWHFLYFYVKEIQLIILYYDKKLNTINSILGKIHMYYERKIGLTIYGDISVVKKLLLLTSAVFLGWSNKKKRKTRMIIYNH